jgi:hypothetical protein
MKILVLSSDVSRYRAAFYQHDFLKALESEFNCVFYGPGFPGFDSKATLENTLAKCGPDIDVILIAHSWLRDNPNHPISPMPRLNLSATSLPKILMLNKEYTRLTEKLSWAKKNRIDHAVSHHHGVGLYESATGIPFTWLPFGVSLERFSGGSLDRKYDVGFSGLLQNPSFPLLQRSTRLDLQKTFFHEIRRIPIRKRREFRNLEFVWSSWSGNRISDAAASLLGFGKMSERDYVRALATTKIWLNSPSPIDIVSTRFFECMAMGAVVLAEESSPLTKIFPDNVYASYTDTTSLLDQIRTLLDSPLELEKIARRAQKNVIAHHTWSLRVKTIMGLVG